MAVFRVDKNRNYTVMSNYHLRDTSLSLKAIGLLSKMLSLTDEWDYTTRGLAAICKEGVDAIGAALKELEISGYLVRRQPRDARGRITDTEYTIYEQPHTPLPGTACPDTEKPDMDSPDTDTPYPEKPAQLSKDQTSPEKRKTDEFMTDESNPVPSSPPTPMGGNGQDGMRMRERYRQIILENIDYDILAQDKRLDQSRLDELVELMVDTVCTNRQMIRIAGDDYPAEVVKSRFLKLNSAHIQYILDRMRENTTYVRNIKKYLLAALYNAPVTMESYYTSLVSHDLYGSGERR